MTFRRKGVPKSPLTKVHLHLSKWNAIFLNALPYCQALPKYRSTGLANIQDIPAPRSQVLLPPVHEPLQVDGGVGQQQLPLRQERPQLHLLHGQPPAGDDLRGLGNILAVRHPGAESQVRRHGDLLHVQVGHHEAQGVVQIYLLT